MSTQNRALLKPERRIGILAFSFLATLICVCCAKSQPKETSSGLKFSFPLQIENEAALSVRKKAILSAVRAGHSVRAEDLIEAVLEDHQTSYNARRPFKVDANSGNAGIFNIAQALKRADRKTQDTWKLAFEHYFESRLASPKYDRSAISAFDLTELHTLQCFSGTITYALSLLHFFGADEIDSQNLVVIFEDGHVLPGFMEQRSGAWYLVGQESTAAGEGRIEYEKASALPSDLRIVSLPTFLFIEVFKFHLSNGVEVGNKALLETAQRYSIPRPYLIDAAKYVKTDDRVTRLNWSPFAFGVPTTPPGTVPRQSLKSTTRQQLKGSTGFQFLAEEVPPVLPTPYAGKEFDVHRPYCRAKLAHPFLPARDLVPTEIEAVECDGDLIGVFQRKGTIVVTFLLHNPTGKEELMIELTADLKSEAALPLLRKGKVLGRSIGMKAPDSRERTEGPGPFPIVLEVQLEGERQIRVYEWTSPTKWSQK